MLPPKKNPGAKNGEHSLAPPSDPKGRRFQGRHSRDRRCRVYRRAIDTFLVRSMGGQMEGVP